MLREWLARLVGVVRARGDEDLAEEVRLHQELAAEQGRAGRVKAGGASQAMDALRDQRGLPWLDELGRDLRYGLRVLARSKGFTAAALISLALGIGANAGVFSLLDQVLLRPLPVHEPERLVQVQWQGNRVGSTYGAGSTLSYPFCRELDELDEIFAGVLCRYPTEVNLSTGREHERTRAEIVSGSYFQVLGVRAHLGRLIEPSDDRQPGAHPVVVLSYDYWTNGLAGAADVIGRRVFVNNHPMTVIGIAPSTFGGVDLSGTPVVWIPAMMKRQATPEWDALFSRRAFWMHAMGRLRPGVTADRARARLEPWFRQMLGKDLQDAEFPPVTPAQRSSFLASTIHVVPATRGVPTLRAGLERPLRVLMAGAGLLLVLASLNVAGLLLARGIARARELATRMALGASRGRVVRQLLVESVLIAAGGGALGVAAAPLVSRVLRSFVSAGANVNTEIDGRVLLFTFAATIVAGAVCGAAPVFLLRRLQVSAAMTERSGTANRSGLRVRKLLVAGQIAFALILLVTAALFVQTLARLQAKGPGFATDDLMMFSLDPPAVGYTDAEAERIMREVQRRLQELKEVERVAAAGSQLLNGGRAGGNLTIDAGERRVTDRIVYRLRVGPEFFETLGMPLVAGRNFDDRDILPGGAPSGPYRAAIVNETFARRYFGDRSPVGARIGTGNRPDTETDIPIIGVVREISRVDLRDQDVDQIFYNFWDGESEAGVFYVKIRGNSESAARAIRAVVAEIAPVLPVTDLMTFEDQIGRSLLTERAMATLSSAFGTIALLLSVVGLYGVMAFVVTQRRREIGLRIALGATPRAAVWLMVRDALVMVGSGIAVALPAVWALRRLVEAQLFGVGPFDGATIALAVAGLVLVALAAAVPPAYRASRLDPHAVLRTE
jgi:predicted permease